MHKINNRILVQYLEDVQTNIQQTYLLLFNFRYKAIATIRSTVTWCYCVTKQPGRLWLPVIPVDMHIAKLCSSLAPLWSSYHCCIPNNCCLRSQSQPLSNSGNISTSLSSMDGIQWWLYLWIYFIIHFYGRSWNTCQKWK